MFFKVYDIGNHNVKFSQDVDFKWEGHSSNSIIGHVPFELVGREFILVNDRKRQNACELSKSIYKDILKICKIGKNKALF